MNDEELDARPLEGYRTYVSPNSPTLGVFRLDTKDGYRWYVVTKEIARHLSESFAQLSEKIADSH